MVLKSFGDHAMQMLGLLEIQNESFGIQAYGIPTRRGHIHRRRSAEMSDFVDGAQIPGVPITGLARHDMRQVPPKHIVASQMNHTEILHRGQSRPDVIPMRVYADPGKCLQPPGVVGLQYEADTLDLSRKVPENPVPENSRRGRRQ